MKFDPYMLFFFVTFRYKKTRYLISQQKKCVFLRFYLMPIVSILSKVSSAAPLNTRTVFMNRTYQFVLVSEDSTAVELFNTLYMSKSNITITITSLTSLISIIMNET